MQRSTVGSIVKPTLSAAGLICLCLGMPGLQQAEAYTIGRQLNYSSPQSGSAQNIQDPEGAGTGGGNIVSNNDNTETVTVHNIQNVPTNSDSSLSADIAEFKEDLSAGGGQDPSYINDDEIIQNDPEQAAALAEFLNDMASGNSATPAETAAPQAEPYRTETTSARTTQPAASSYVTESSDSGYWHIPAPVAGHDYKSDNKSVTQQGNAYIDVKSAGLKTAETSEFAKEMKNSEKLSGKELVEMRLAAYDLERWKAAQEKRNMNPFGDLRAMEKVYLKLPTGADTFYVRSVLDRDSIKEAISDIQSRFEEKEENLHGEIGFTVLDDEGILMLYNNTEFPLGGISSFHLAFAAASAMSRLGDSPENYLRFDLNALDFARRSPFALLKRSEPSMPVEYLPQGESQSTKDNADVQRKALDDMQKRREAIAKAARRAAQGDGFVSKSERQALQASSTKVSGGKSLSDLFAEDTDYNNLTVNAKSVLEGQRNLMRTSEVESLKDPGDLSKIRLTESSISTLIFYLLTYSDHNAFDVLLSYLGSVSALAYEIKAKGMEHTQYGVNYSDIIKQPELNYRNRGTLYDMAKSMAAYIKDKDISLTARGVIDNVLLFNPGDRHGIQRGIQNSIKNDKFDDKETLKILSINGKSGFTPENRSLVYTDLAYVEYKGERFIIIFGVKDCRGNTVDDALFKAEELTAYAGNRLFDILRSQRPFLGVND